MRAGIRNKSIMKYFFSVCICVCCSCIAAAQTYSVHIDSLTRISIGRLPRDKQVGFDSLLIQRHAVDFFKRLDTTTYAYVFIEEIYCYAEGWNNRVTERYYAVADTFPQIAYHNGTPCRPGEYWVDFLQCNAKGELYEPASAELMQQYTQFQPLQKSACSKEQMWMPGCTGGGPGAEKRFRQMKKRELTSTYRINTLVDTIHRKVIVSVQYPPHTARFRIHRIGDGGYW